jgi:hypothetical protein
MMRTIPPKRGTVLGVSEDCSVVLREKQPPEKQRNRDRADGSSSAQTLGTNSTLIFVSNTGLFSKSRDIFNLRSAERDLTNNEEHKKRSLQLTHWKETRQWRQPASNERNGADYREDVFAPQR